MTIKQLHELTATLIANNQADANVAIDFSTFAENDNGSILEVESADMRTVEAADDSGPTGDKFPFLVMSGGLPNT
jgi:hypothetical protein